MVDSPANRADISRAASVIKYRPSVDLFTGLEREVEWYNGIALPNSGSGSAVSIV